MMLLQEMNLFFLFNKQVQDCWFSRGGMREIQWTHFVSWYSPTQNREIVPGSVQSMQLNSGRERNNSNLLRRNSGYFCNAHSILDKLPLHRGAWQQGKADTAPTMTCVNTHISGHQYWYDSLWQSKFILPAKCILTFYPLLFFKLKGS